MRDTYIASLNDIDAKYPKPNICNILSKKENTDLLEYVIKDPFGCHIFPGDIDNYPLTSFYEDMNKEIKKQKISISGSIFQLVVIDATFVSFLQLL